MLVALLAACGLYARESRPEDLKARYLQIQESYTRRSDDIGERLKKASRDLLNEYILSLVRIEQHYKDEGNLDGVVVSRELREEALTTREFPEIPEEAPDKIREKIRDLLERREEIRKRHQKELDALNRVLIDALEPYQVEFTKQGELDTAVEILDIRKLLMASLGDAGNTESGPSGDGAPATVSNDPNTYGFCLEPGIYAEVPGVTARQPEVPVDGEVRDDVEVREKGCVFNQGVIHFPDRAMSALLRRVKKNQMLTVEFALRPHRGRLGDEEIPSPILVYGNHPGDANLAITQEGRNLYLRLRTTSPPAGGLHKINLGRAETGRAQHVMITYRNTELTVYRDGVEAFTNRKITGLLTNWEEYPMMMGGLIPTDSTPSPPEHEIWRGVLYQFYLKAGMETSRNAADNYSRFSRVISH